MKAIKCLGTIPFVLSLLFVSSCSTTPTNDKEYSIAEIQGKYSASKTWTNANNSDNITGNHLVVISDEKWVETTTICGVRTGCGLPTTETYQIKLTKTNISVNNEVGYIKSESGKIVIVWNELNYTSL